MKPRWWERTHGGRQSGRADTFGGAGRSPLERLVGEEVRARARGRSTRGDGPGRRVAPRPARAPAGHPSTCPRSVLSRSRAPRRTPPASRPAATRRTTPRRRPRGPAPRAPSLQVRAEHAVLPVECARQRAEVPVEPGAPLDTATGGADGSPTSSSAAPRRRRSRTRRSVASWGHVVPGTAGDPTPPGRRATGDDHLWPPPHVSPWATVGA